MHQGDQDGRKGLYHINAVDEVTQWEIVAATPQISELWLLPVLEALLGQFPFVIRGFHSDNGSEFINYNVARLLGKLLIEQTKSRAYHSGDNGLVESKNGAIIRKHIGYGHIDAQHAEAMDQFHRQHLNPYVNFHRPCAVPKVITAANGKRRRVYERWATPFELFRELPRCENLPAARGHAGRAGALRPDPIRYRSRAGHAARQAQALRQLPPDRAPHEPAASRASRWSAIGRVPRSGVHKTKTFLRRENQQQVRRPRAPPVGRPRGFETPSERRLSAGSLRSRLQAHPSMRICCARTQASPACQWVSLSHRRTPRRDGNFSLMWKRFVETSAFTGTNQVCREPHLLGYAFSPNSRPAAGVQTPQRGASKISLDSVQSR